MLSCLLSAKYCCGKYYYCFLNFAQSDPWHDGLDGVYVCIAATFLGQVFLRDLKLLGHQATNKTLNATLHCKCVRRI